MRNMVPGTHTTLLSAPTKLRICTACADGDGSGRRATKSGHCAAHCRRCDAPLSQVMTFSLPAVKSCPGSVMAKNVHVRAAWLANSEKLGRKFICDSCYADGRGNYMWKVVQNAQETRFNWIKEAIKTDETMDVAVEVMVKAIKSVTRTTKRFRIHESGDFFSPRYVIFWTKVVARLPDVTFWAPTRTWHFKAAAWINVLTDFYRQSNVVLRPSALEFDTAAPMLEGYAAGTTAHFMDYAPNGEHECPASKGAHNCGPCTACWDKPMQAQSYQAHTLQAKANSEVA